jgi:hypothetical protein
MRFHALLALFAAAAGPFTAIATDPDRKPSDGWVNLLDGNSTFGWATVGDVKVDKGLLVIGKDKPGAANPLAIFGPHVEYRLEFLGGTVRTTIAETTVNDADRVCHFKLLRSGETKQEYFEGVDQNRLKVVAAKSAESPDFEWSLVGSPERPMTLKSAWARVTVTTSLFDGKSLAGWKQYKGDPKREQSKFEVTAAGELRITNGPGDLQTEKTFKNFALQIDCKTNGKLLNSGVFFRGLPGQYQQGYEAQIQNGFKDNDRTKPTDFGTGAIYRRIATRKVVPNDNEWFTMTVLANGPRICTWVNGEPTVNWLDERPKNGNARQGCKLDAGVISLQGHDPTTDLLFKNIRIAEIEK